LSKHKQIQRQIILEQTSSGKPSTINQETEEKHSSGSRLRRFRKLESENLMVMVMDAWAIATRPD